MCLVVGVFGCDVLSRDSDPLEEPSRATVQAARSEEPAAETAAAAPAPPTSSEEASADPADPCAEEWSRLAALEALPGAPRLEERRVEVLARSPSTPVVFLRVPGEGEELPVAAARLRATLDESGWSRTALQEVLRQTRLDLPLRRRALLREGYLYAEEPAAALRLAETLRFDHLFDEPEIVVERGGERFVLKRRKGYYVHPEAPAEPAHLLLFDRVTLPKEPAAGPLHFSLSALAAELGFSSARVERLTAEGALVELDYGGVRTQGVLDLSAPEASLRCERVAPELAETLASHRDWALRRRKAFVHLRDVIDAMVEEALPFDEPKTEIGQQDGQLRPAWITAYRKGELEYEFNGDTYPVFDGRGRPRVPQVCVDFITDAFERAGGGWWRGRKEPRERLGGVISFRKLGIENTRSVENLAVFAWMTPEWFDVHWLPRAERVPFGKRREFFRHLAEHAERYQLGDVIVIYGLRSDDRNHYHSFFVYEADPVTGAPIVVAANAGRPRLRTWEGEMRSAPKRTIVARLRPRLSFLETLMAADEPLQAPRRVRWVEPTLDGDSEEGDLSEPLEAEPG